MSYQDRQMMFSIDQAITTAATYDSTDAIDLEAAPPRAVGDGEIVRVSTQVTEAFAGGTSINIQLVQADDVGLDTNVEVLAETGVIALADNLDVLGARFPLMVPAQQVARRFIGMNYVGLGVFTAGKFTSGIQIDEQQADAGPTGVAWATGF